MFWWAIPVMGTGFLLFCLFGIILMLLEVTEALVDFSCELPVKIAIMAAVVIPCAIGLIMMVGGFFFWALGEIWTPYL